MRATTPGSRSGAGETASALGYPGVPPAIPNCTTAQLLSAGPGGAGLFFTFPGPGRIWQVMLTYVITSNNSFTPATMRTLATITTSGTVSGNLVLAAVQLGVAGAGQHDSGISEPSYGGLPIVSGTSLNLIINGGTVVSNLDQTASAVVLYSLP